MLIMWTLTNCTYMRDDGKVFIVIGIVLFGIAMLMSPTYTTTERICVETGEPYNDGANCGHADTMVADVQKDRAIRAPLLVLGGLLLGVGGYVGFSTSQSEVDTDSRSSSKTDDFAMEEDEEKGGGEEGEGDRGVGEQGGDGMLAPEVPADRERLPEPGLLPAELLGEELPQGLGDDRPGPGRPPARDHPRGRRLGAPGRRPGLSAIG
jgi:hypothetical protein